MLSSPFCWRLIRSNCQFPDLWLLHRGLSLSLYTYSAAELIILQSWLMMSIGTFSSQCINKLGVELRTSNFLYASILRVPRDFWSYTRNLWEWVNAWRAVIVRNNNEFSGELYFYAIRQYSTFFPDGQPWHDRKVTHTHIHIHRDINMISFTSRSLSLFLFLSIVLFFESTHSATRTVAVSFSLRFTVFLLP